MFNQPGGIIKLKFTSIDLELSDNCTEDYIIVRDGIQDTSPVLGRFCGNIDQPVELNSTGHELMVRFISNAEQNHAGFELEYERYIEGLFLSSLFPTGKCTEKHCGGVYF